MRIFISCEKKDSAFVDKLEEALKSIGINPMKVNLKAQLGEDIFDMTKLNRTVSDCDQVIVVLSPSYTYSSWLVGESWAFFMKEKIAETEILLPIIIEDCAIPVHLEGRICADFKNTDFKKAFDQLVARISKNRQVFIIMQYGDKTLESAYDNAIKIAVKAAEYSPIRIDRVSKAGKIDDQILTQIARSEVVLADLTGERPNCYYETGYAHALGKELVLTIQKGARVHFNLAAYRFIEWGSEEELKAKLEERFNDIRQKNRLRADRGGQRLTAPRPRETQPSVSP